jgi:serine/threonine-protein kinase
VVRPVPIPAAWTLGSRRTESSPTVDPASDPAANHGDDVDADDPAVDAPAAVDVAIDAEAADADAASDGAPVAVDVATTAALASASADGPGTGEVAAVAPAPSYVGADGAGRPRRRWPWVLGVLVLLLGGGGIAAAVTYDPPSTVPDRAIVLPVPSVSGLDEKAATTLLEAAGWEVDAVKAHKNGTTAGALIDLEPDAGTRLARGRTVTLTVSQGPTIVTLPQGLVGKPIAEVQQAFKAKGLATKVAEHQNHEDIGAGALIGYAAGTAGTAPFGATIGLIESDGPAPREVPGVTGRSEAGARQALAAVQLAARVTPAYSDRVASGLVISQDVPAGTMVDRGATVALVVSRGPQLVMVPDVSWTTSTTQAIAVLRARGLVAGTVSGPADGTPKGTSPVYGTKVRKGSTVNIILG